MTGILVKRRDLDTRDKHAHHVNMKAKTRVMDPQAKDRQTLKFLHQDAGKKGGTESPSQPSKEPTLLTPSSCSSGLQKGETIHFHGSKPPVLVLVMAARGNYHNYCKN